MMGVFFMMVVVFMQENNMSVINEQIKWEDEVYLLVCEDWVEGGIYGLLNKQVWQLVNCICYLKIVVELLQDYWDYIFFMILDDLDGIFVGFVGMLEGKFFCVVVFDSEG